MKKILFTLIAAILAIVSGNSTVFSQESNQNDLFFHNSLHSTANGMAYWYGEEQGGLETLTGISYSALGCGNCHVSSCDVCHKVEMDGKLSYSTKAASNQEMCLTCHAREASIMKVDKSKTQEDVHFAQGMQCMDCHSAREMHGDGVEYNSMKQQGAMDTNCEKCHDAIGESTSHKIHGDKVDCKACHVRHVVSCTNCHFETLVKEGKRVAIPVSDWLFLMNYDGKVTSANMQTFVVEHDKTFLMFAPQFSHSVMNKGRKCEECHATETVKQVQKGQVNLTWMENGEMKHIHGVIPVGDGVKWNFVPQDRENEKWIPIENPAKPVLHYAGYGTPLSKEQLKRLSKTQRSK